MKKILIIMAVFALVLTGCTAQNTADNMAQASDAEEQSTQTAEQTVAQEEDTVGTEEENFLDVTMYDIDGNEWNLAQLGQKAVVKVWASWCSICLSGMDEYNTFASEYKDAKVLTVVTPDMYGEQSKEDFIKWFKSLDDYKDTVVILDEEGLLINTLGIRGFPTYVYINSAGYVVSGAVGHQQTADVIARLESIE